MATFTQPLRRCTLLPLLGAIAVAFTLAACSSAPQREKAIRPEPGSDHGPDPFPPGIKNDERGQVYALFVGISRYEDSEIPALRFGESDATALYNFAIRELGLNIPAENVRLLVNRDATLQGIVDGIQWLNRRCTSDDTAIVYFSGHGAVDVRPGGAMLGNYLLPFDVRSSDGLSGFERTTALPISGLRQKLMENASGTLLLLLDACFSGGVGGNFSTVVLESGQLANSLEELKRFEEMGAGRYILTATAPNQPALEIGSLQHGLFTYYLLEALERDSNDDGLITLGEVAEYIEPRVVKRAAGEGFTQTPRQYVIGGSRLVLRTVPRSIFRATLRVEYPGLEVRGSASPPSRPQASGSFDTYRVSVGVRETSVPLYAYVLKVWASREAVHAVRIVPNAENLLAPPEIITASPERIASYPDEPTTGASRARLGASERNADTVFILIAKHEPIESSVLEDLQRRLSAAAIVPDPDSLCTALADVVKSEERLGEAALRYVFVRHRDA